MSAIRHALRAILLGAALSQSPLITASAADAPKAATEKSAREKLDAAQRRLEEAAREVADLSMSMSDVDMPRITAAMARPRAFLGLNMGVGDKENDGVELLSVSPGGAGASAGLQAGDVVTELNGKSLKREGDESPRKRLMDAMREVNPGDKVSVRYRRAGKVQSGTLVAQAPPERMLMFGSTGIPGALPALPSFAFTRSDGVFGSAELVALTPKLGRYFGIDKGLLVVRAPDDERLKLEEGDVIVDIGGRVPEDAAHASRILASYEKGEKLRLNVLRLKQKLTLDIEVPEHQGNTLFERRLERSGGWGPGTFDRTITLPGPVTAPAMPLRPEAVMVPGIPVTAVGVAGSAV